jgi:Tfp pilus assembly protein FimT
VICPSTDGASCADDSHWADGRIVFVDVDKDGTRTAASEPLLRKTDALSGSPAVTASGFPNTYLTFSPYGSLSPSGSAGSLKLCASSSEGRLVSLTTSGRPAATKVACP